MREHRRSTRLSLQIPVVVTSLDPACDFRKDCKTVMVNAHGCSFIASERLKDGTPVMMKLASGASKKGRVVLAIRLRETVSWLLGVEFDSGAGNFWEVENPPADWRV